MKRDVRAERARREAQARLTVERQRNQRRAIHRQASNLFKHDLGDAVGYSPTWETMSPNRHASVVSTTDVDPTKTPGTGE